jgi:tetratricopeptide (TPR) repeat protein
MSQRDGKFPTISDGFYTSKVIQKNDRPNDRAAERLPSIPLSRGASAYGATTDKGVTKENTLVVGTSQSAPGGGVALPEEWTKMRVNPPQEDDSHMTKLEWENQIAKHILSLFATSHAVRNISEGNALLDFVEVDKSQVKSPDKRSNNTVDLLHTRPAQRPTPLPDIEENEIDQETGDTDAVVNGKAKTKAKTKKKVKRVSKEKKTVENEETLQTRRSTPSRPQGISESEYAAAERVILRVHAEAEREEQLRGKTKAREKDKHRITNTIRLQDGREIVVRGTPRCYPIWFVSTGDVFADWTALPGGVKLQAHLNALYEQQKYSDYLGILETLIIELWRKVKYGKEEFSLGSFGHSATASAGRTGSNTGGTNSGLNTGGNTARSRRNSRSGGRPRKGSSGSPAGSPYRDTGRHGVDSPADADSQFGAAIVWEDAGEEGLIPKKVGSALSPVLKEGHKKKGHKERRVSNDELHTSRSADTGVGGTLTGVGQDSQHEVPEPMLPPETLTALWKQLVMAAIAMGILYLEKKVPDQAMLLFKRAEEWAANDEVVPHKLTRKELKGHVRDAISYYFFKRKKSIAALGYSEQAMALYEETDNLDGIAVCLLHVAAVYSQIGDFKEAHKVSYDLYVICAVMLVSRCPVLFTLQKLFQFLAMVEAGRLASADATPKQLCLVAIGYHNLAVVQLKLAMPDLACKNSQNARKIARLCLSYSNRWIDTFQYTHEIAIADIKYELSAKKAKDLSPAQLALVIELSEALFDPYSDVNQVAAVV